MKIHDHMSFFRKKSGKIILLLTTLIVVSLIVFAVSQYYSVLQTQIDPNRAAKVADKLAHAVGATIHPAGTRRYPWGTVWIFEERNPNGSGVVVEVNQITNVVTSMRILGSSPVDVKIDEASAFAAAEQFLKSNALDVDLNNLRPLVISPGEDGTIKLFEIKWSALAQSGALLPAQITVDVDAETGKVRDYSNITSTVKINTNPQVSKEQALQILLQPSGKLPTNVSIGDPLLEVIFDPSILIGQRLVWRIPVTVHRTGDSIIINQSNTIAIDANSQEVIDLNGIYSQYFEYRK